MIVRKKIFSKKKIVIRFFFLSYICKKMNKILLKLKRFCCKIMECCKKFTSLKNVALLAYLHQLNLQNNIVHITEHQHFTFSKQHS